MNSSATGHSSSRNSAAASTDSSPPRPASTANPSAASAKLPSPRTTQTRERAGPSRHRRAGRGSAALDDARGLPRQHPGAGGPAPCPGTRTAAGSPGPRRGTPGAGHRSCRRNATGRGRARGAGDLWPVEALSGGTVGGVVDNLVHRAVIHGHPHRQCGWRARRVVAPNSPALRRFGRPIPTARSSYPQSRRPGVDKPGSGRLLHRPPVLSREAEGTLAPGQGKVRATTDRPCRRVRARRIFSVSPPRCRRRLPSRQWLQRAAMNLMDNAS